MYRPASNKDFAAILALSSPLKIIFQKIFWNSKGVVF